MYSARSLRTPLSQRARSEGRDHHKHDYRAHFYFVDVVTQRYVSDHRVKKDLRLLQRYSPEPDQSTRKKASLAHFERSLQLSATSNALFTTEPTSREWADYDSAENSLRQALAFNACEEKPSPEMTPFVHYNLACVLTSRTSLRIKMRAAPRCAEIDFRGDKKLVG